jgi:flagellar biosynthesis component FlhA
MKKLIVTGVFIVLGSIASNIFAGPLSGWNSNNNSQNQFGKARGIMKQMRKIRMNTIQANPQSEQTFQQIQTLRKQLNQNLHPLLKSNSTYQNLLQQLKAIRSSM